SRRYLAKISFSGIAMPLLGSKTIVAPCPRDADSAIKTVNAWRKRRQCKLTGVSQRLLDDNNPIKYFPRERLLKGDGIAGIKSPATNRPIWASMHEICSEPGPLTVTVKRSGRYHISSSGLSIV